VRIVLTEGFPPRVIALLNAQLPVSRLADFLLSRMPQIERFSGEQSVLGLLTLNALQVKFLNR
jgi:hypothetical protein